MISTVRARAISFLSFVLLSQVAQATPVQPTTIAGLQLWLKGNEGVYTGTFTDDS